MNPISGFIHFACDPVEMGFIHFAISGSIHFACDPMEMGFIHFAISGVHSLCMRPNGNGVHSLCMRPSVDKHHKNKFIAYKADEKL